MIQSQWFSISAEPWAIAFAIFLVVGCLMLSFIALKRTGFKRSHCLLEALRILLVALVALAVCQPEWLQKFMPVSEPTMVVLWDESDSMTTVDVVDRTELKRPAISRAESIKPLTEDAFWSRLASNEDEENRLQVVVEPFSSSLSKPKKGSDLNAALDSLATRYENLRAVVMMSDGGWNTGKAPTEAATQLRMKGVPVFAVGVGSEAPLPDLEIGSLDAPTFGVVGKPTRIPFSVNSTLPRDVTVNLTLESTDGDRMRKTYTIPANGKLQEAFVWQPKRVGEYELKLTLPVADGERILANNELTTPIEIRKESLKVLVVESFPRWEFRYLRNALMRDPGVEVSCVLYHPSIQSLGGGEGYLQAFPQSVDELAEYDVIFLGDVGVGEQQLTDDDCRRIKGLVENQATGLIFMPGFRGRQLSLTETELSPLLPVIFDQRQPRGWGNRAAAKFALTEEGSQSLLTKLADTPEANDSVWRSLPGFQWYAPVLRAKVGSQVLAVHGAESNENGRVALLVTKTFGAGKILFMGTDGAWRWRKGVEDRYHYRFWGQVARWMAYQRNMAGGDGMRLFYAPDRPQTGQTLTMNANVMTIAGEPLQNGTVIAQIVAPSGDSQRVRLASQASAQQWGLFSGFFVPEENGQHLVMLSCAETGSQLETTINVQGLERERIGKPANLSALKEIAILTRGKTVTTNQVNDLFDEIDKLPRVEPQLKRFRLWASPYWAGMMIALLSIFWVGRKLTGVI